MKKQKRWVIADTHFGHTNIIKYENRPFKDTQDMDEKLIYNWNSVVSKQDIVYMLGDFTLSRNKEYIKSLLQRLNGKIILIMGNHDLLKPAQYIELGFYTAIRKPILVEPNVVLMHEPPLKKDVCDKMFYIYGHVHSNPSEVEFNSNCRCVSVERIQYKPIELEMVIDIYLSKNLDYIVLVQVFQPLQKCY